MSRRKRQDKHKFTSRSRRNFLKLAMALSSLLALGGIAAILKSITNPAPPGATTTGVLSFPKVKIAELGELAVGQPVEFNYPLDDEPNILIKLGTKAEGGIGPEGDIVAFSTICQHLGCIYGFQPAGDSPACNPAFKAAGPVGYCCCHGSVYDLTNGAAVISGPSPRPQPQVTLDMDSSGNIYAMGMGPPTIFGHNTGSNDVSGDLQGGTPVG